MGNIRLVVFIIAAFLSLITLLIGVSQPNMHKQAMFTDEYHEFVEEEIPTASVGFFNVSTPQSKVQVQQVQQPVSRKLPPIVKTVYKQVPVQQAQAPKSIQQSKPVVKQELVQQTVSTPNYYQEPKKTEIKQVVSDNPKRELTEQEEIIAWNKWRSRLQNQVMMDSKVRAPLGTAFKFSFTVDKYGNMSNIKVWSTNPSYNNLAVNVIKPVLSSYQHKPILNFPDGTKRVITNVNGGFYISTQTVYSTPADYSDYERVKR